MSCRKVGASSARLLKPRRARARCRCWACISRAWASVLKRRLILSQLSRLEKTRFVPPIALAAVQAALGDVGAALDSLDRAHTVRDQRLILKDDPRWVGLRKQARFAALMLKPGLDRFGPGLSPP